LEGRQEGSQRKLGEGEGLNSRDLLCGKVNRVEHLIVLLPCDSFVVKVSSEWFVSEGIVYL
jgi:hypothetical protein